MEHRILLSDGSWYYVHGHKLKIKGFECIDLFIHRETDSNFFCVSEKSTGMSATKGSYETVREAVTAAYSKLSQHGHLATLLAISRYQTALGIANI